ncbi:hypothetical protein FVE67_05320 [Thermosulfurimonas marina]|uniref:Endonuclease MutS2 n=1 Tax=Thermosulfurimonas marina TaxID=2047767 RepID=A0A6H1WSV4_9BACT|nr:Smr/MutS family protein [Thermosulfurimonas marina]QJA06258.1 hypothetical protein FVE67_05320 [Thermosulfurimonas marina]
MPGTLEKLEWPGLLAHLKKRLRTAAGEALLEGLSPAFSFEQAQARQERFREVFRFREKRTDFSLPRLPALAPLVKKAQRGGLLYPEELYALAEAFSAGKALGELSFFPEVSPLEPLLRELERALAPGGKDLADEASWELAEARRRYRRLFERLHALMEDLLRRYARAGVLREELIFQRKGRLVLPVRSEYRARVPGILHDVSQTGATVFIEPAEAVPVANELERARLEEERAKRKVLARLSALVAERAPEIYRLEEALAEVDLALALFELSRSWRGRFPRLKPSGSLRLLSAAHPFFFLAGETPVRNDFRLSPERPVLVISGPNFGGKTVAAKTVGLCVLMAQAGFPLPASEDSEIPVFSRVLADLGDEQELSSGESTFSAHLRELAEILEGAGPGSLVILDEPGRGTDPREGAALSVAVLERLETSGAFIVATTHFSEVKRYALSSPRARPAGMLFDERFGRPTYRLVYGLVGASHGLGLARRRLPEEVVDRAEALLSGGEDYERLLAEIRRLEETLREKEALLAEKERALALEESRLAERRREVERHLTEERERLRAEVWERLRKLEAEMAPLARKAEGPRTRERVFREQVEEVLAPLQERVPERLQPGQKVYLLDLRKEAEVLRDLGREVEVRAGAFRLAVPRKSIKVLSDVRPEPRVRISVSASPAQSDSLHLLGLRVDEALAQLETFLNRALLEGRREVRIVHGLGTGRLLTAVRAYLEGHEAVEALRPGSPLEGGEGVTVVRLASPAATKGRGV